VCERRFAVVSVKRAALKAPRVKWYVKAADSDREFALQNLAEFIDLYRIGFIGPDDLVRRGSARDWTAVRDMPELRYIKKNDRRDLVRLIAITAVLVISLLLVLAMQYKIAPH
jgi:hypothetical protein